MLERLISLFNAVLCNDHHLQTVTDFDVSLNGTGEGIHDDLFNVLLRQRLGDTSLQGVTLSRARDVLISEVDLIVEEGHDQTRGGTSGTALLSLVTAYRVV